VQFLQRIVTGGETWVHHVTPETKQASITHIVMATVFWDHKGVLFVDFLIQGDTVNADCYCDTLSRLREAVLQKRPGLLQRGVVLLHDNARSHTVNCTLELLWRYNWEVLDYPPYSPDLAPSDFHLFGPFKKHLGGRRFVTDGEVKQAVMSWIQALDTDSFNAGIDPLVYRWDKCVGKYGDYVEK
jgi:histone-lysine N-methyltransferase SETMAR